LIEIDSMASLESLPLKGFLGGGKLDESMPRAGFEV